MESIWIKEVKAISKSKYKVIPEYNSPFVLYKGELKRYGIKEQMELSGQVYEEILREVLLKRGKKRAMYLLQKNDYTEDKLRSKLKDNDYPPEIIEEVIAFLYSYHYLDDQRFVTYFVDRNKDHMSPAELRRKLTERGADRDLIDRVLEETELPDQRELLHKYAEKKHFNGENADEKERNRMVRFLISKGFSYDLIRRELLDIK